MVVRLVDIAQLRFGFYSKPVESGNAAYLLAKHFDEMGNQTDEVDTVIQIDNKNDSHLLEDGDILLVGKGSRNFAWTYKEAFGPAVASSIFFVIKVDRSKVIPEFLTTFFNMSQTQAYFQALGAGSSIPSIRKSELGGLNIPLPALQKQQTIVNIAQLHQHEITITHELIEQKKILFNAIISKVIQ